MRTTLAALTLAVALVAGPAMADRAGLATLYKNPQCGCCDAYAAHLRDHGFAVVVEELPDLMALKRAHGVPQGLEGCHTLLLDGYVVEGHVPVATLLRLLRERPDDVRGIALPGMPQGSPGMSGVKQGPFEIRAFGDDGIELYAVE